MKINLKYIPINQKGYIFYSTVIKASVLKQICSVSMDDISFNSDLYQRSLKDSRVKKIAEFIKRDEGIMPPSIVLNSRNKLIFEGEYITIDDSKDQFFIIDGQHRLAGVFESKEMDYEFSVIIMDNVDVDFQSELFVSINNEQKKVDPNVKFRIKANSGVCTPERVVRDIAFILNETKASPFYEMIKVDDLPFSSEKSCISISSFAEPILLYIYNINDYFDLKDRLKERKCINAISGKLNDIIKYNDRILWNLYRTDNWQVITKIFLNYFTAVAECFSKTWGNKKYIIKKTTGYNALMMLFSDVFSKCKQNNNNFSYKFILNTLSPLSSLDGSITVDKYGLGKVASSRLYYEMKKLVFGENSGFGNISIFDDLEETIDFDD